MSAFHYAFEVRKILEEVDQKGENSLNHEEKMGYGKSLKSLENLVPAKKKEELLTMVENLIK